MIYLVLLIASLASFSAPSLGSEAMIQEVEGLLKSLPAEDPGRRELTLRLADLYFFVATDLNKRASLSMDTESTSDELHPDKLDEKAEQFRQRALNLYRKSLKKFKLNRETRIKVGFQQARLLDQLGRKREALVFWKKSYQQKEVINIRREAILKLAEDVQEGSDLDKAERLYKEALTLCEEVCGFVHYRLGWVYRNQGRIIPALKEIEQALWDNKGQAQDEVLRDYIAFLAIQGGDGSRAIGIVENLVERTGRKDLLEQLAFGFYSAGNKQAGTKALALITQRNPVLENQIRLLEEYYGLRRWDEFRELRERIVPAKISILEKDAAKKVEQIMRRLAVQLEAEQKQKSQTRSEFLAVADLYLELFPKSEVAMKIIRSWLSAEKRQKVKMKKIAYWLGGKGRQFSAEDEIMLREERVRLAQEQKAYAVVRSEMEQLAGLYQTTEKKEKAKYLIAYSYYQENKFDMALPLFIQLAKAHGPPSSKRPMPSKWAIQSQHLILDIFNQRKDYQQLMTQADLWLKQKWESSLIEKELTDIRRVREQASFENAAIAGETSAALEVFFGFCKLGKFVPKSCQNAKRLSIILKDQLKLLAVLEKLNDKKTLVNEYEISGRYTKAAALLIQKTPLLKKQWSFQEAIKIALLYELENDLAKRNRWLELLAERYRKKTVPAQYEELFYRTLRDAKKLNIKSLSLKWSPNLRPRLIRFLEENNQGNRQTHQKFLAQIESQGELWEYFHLKKIYELAQKEGSTTFYGKNSKRNFKQRLARIKKFDMYSNKILEQLGRERRIQVIRLLYTAYSNLEQEIKKTPIPEGLDEAALAQIKNSLVVMAHPFAEKALSYKDLLQTELNKIDEVEQRQLLLSKNIEPKALLAEFKRPQAKKVGGEVNMENVFMLLRQLRKNPFSRETISSLKDLYSEKRQMRLASYYEGRLRQTQGVVR